MGSSTIFDDVLRTIQERRPKLLVPLVNEVFQMSYSEDTHIERLPEEYQKVISKVVADSCSKLGNQIYHLECQSKTDGSMIFRMVEYDFMIALVDSRRKKEEKRLKFPRSCVLYLRATRNTLDEEKMEIEMPDGQVITYRVPILKLKDYGIDEIFEKNLLILLPYYMINYEKDISKIAKDMTRTKKLVQEYGKIIERLEEVTKNDDTGAFQDVLQMMRRVMRHLLRKEPELKERMGNVMGGKVLPLPSDKLREQLEKGRAAGLEQGINQTIGALIETCKEFHQTKEDTVLRVVKKFSMSSEDALALVEEHWN